MTFSSPLNFVTNEWQEPIPYGSTSTFGYVSQSRGLYDGLACNDGSSTIRTRNQNSYISY